MPPVDTLAEIKTELRRWHLGRVLVHQFSKLARRMLPEPQPEKRRRTDDDTGGGLARWQRYRWQRVRPYKEPEVGLAAFKHAQQQEQRAAMARDFRAAESTADTRKPPPDQDGGAVRSSKRGRSRSRQVGRFRK